MQITDEKVAPSASVAREAVVLPYNPAISLTNRLVGVVAPGVGFQLVGCDTFCSTKAGTAAFSVYIGGLNEIVVATTIAKHSVAEQLATAICRVLVGGKYVEKAAATAITFTAAHVVTASKFGCILVQIDNAGTISTKVVAATQAYDTAAEALVNLPAADSGNVRLGYIAIANNAGDWTANTDDLTDGSDLTTATFVSDAATVLSPFTGAITPLAMERVAGTLSSTLANIRTRDAAKRVYIVTTTDGSAALTNGAITLRYRPYPMAGE